MFKSFLGEVEMCPGDAGTEKGGQEGGLEMLSRWTSDGSKLEDIPDPELDTRETGRRNYSLCPVENRATTEANIWREIKEKETTQVQLWVALGDGDQSPVRSGKHQPVDMSSSQG